MRSATVRISAILLMIAAAFSHAATVVAPNANMATPGTGNQFAPFGNGGDVAFTFQELVSASQLASTPSGSEITGIAFRLSNLETTVTTAATYPQFDVQIGKLATSVTAPSTRFADNMGSDTVLARSGSLTIPANSFAPGAPTGPFVEIAFATPYTYTGGDLAITIRDQLAGLYRIGIDAVSVGPAVGTVASPGLSTDTMGVANFFTAPIIRFTYVPEPAMFLAFSVLAVVALGRWQ